MGASAAEAAARSESSSPSRRRRRRRPGLSMNHPPPLPRCYLITTTKTTKTTNFRLRGQEERTSTKLGAKALQGLCHNNGGRPSSFLSRRRDWISRPGEGRRRTHLLKRTLSLGWLWALTGWVAWTLRQLLLQQQQCTMTRSVQERLWAWMEDFSTGYAGTPITDLAMIPLARQQQYPPPHTILPYEHFLQPFGLLSGFHHNHDTRQNNWTSLLNLSSSSTSTPLICVLVPTARSSHFAHAMEQLYRCVSWWLQSSNVVENQTISLSEDSNTHGMAPRERILVMMDDPWSTFPLKEQQHFEKDEMYDQMPTLPHSAMRYTLRDVLHLRKPPADFLRGFLQALQQSPFLNVQVHNSWDFLTARLSELQKDHMGQVLNSAQHRPHTASASDLRSAIYQAGLLPVQARSYKNYVVGNYAFGDYGFALASPQDARLLSRGLLAQWERSGQDETCATGPRVAVLNREPYTSKRSILNAPALAYALEQALVAARPPSSVEDAPAPVEVPVVYFENKTFAEQVQFFVSVDLVISPHGAQLTGIPFMPACGSVLELFPPHYYAPDYFGGLAQAAGLHYASMYLPNRNGYQDNLDFLTDSFRRGRAKNTQFCPSLDSVVHAVMELVQNWQTCCQTFQPR